MTVCGDVKLVHQALRDINQPNGLLMYCEQVAHLEKLEGLSNTAVSIAKCGLKLMIVASNLGNKANGNHGFQG